MVSAQDAAIERLVTAVIVGTHDEWGRDRARYLPETSMACVRQDADGARTTTIAATAGQLRP